MRIIAGRYKGRRWSLPPGSRTRPTTDMAREGLFNILQGYTAFEGISVLDLFCGSGAIALEFLSRGARSVTAVDVDTKIKRHLESLAQQWNAQGLRLVRADAYKIIDIAEGKYDLVFADPPYSDRRYAELPGRIEASGWLSQGGLLVVEHPPSVSFDSHPRLARAQGYGTVHFSIFQF